MIFTEEEEPKIPMKVGTENAETFKVTKSRRQYCPLITGASTTYKVLKTQRQFQFQFFAIHGTEEFTLHPEEVLEPYLIFLRNAHRYVNQVGFAECHCGYVDRVDVNKKDKITPKNARQCGIATVLSMLCFIDPEIHAMGEDNAGYIALGLSESNEYRETADLFRKKCKKIVSLQMAANPKDGAYEYFSAATNTGFTKLAVLWWNFQRLAIYDTETARENYNKDSGSISPSGGNDNEVLAFNADWIFCDPGIS